LRLTAILYCSTRFSLPHEPLGVSGLNPVAGESKAFCARASKSLLIHHFEERGDEESLLFFGLYARELHGPPIADEE